MEAGVAPVFTSTASDLSAAAPPGNNNNNVSAKVELESQIETSIAVGPVVASESTLSSYPSQQSRDAHVVLDLGVEAVALPRG